MEQHVLSKIVDCILWWSQRRDRLPSVVEAFKEFNISFNREHLELVAGWWTIAEETYIAHFQPRSKRKVSTKDDTDIARLMASLIYSEYSGEPGGQVKENKRHVKGVLFAART
jgi:hypothetical protein